jgi:hypothetical protein
MTMRLRAICTITFEYDADPMNYYGADTTKDEAIKVDTDQFNEDHDMFFELADTHQATYTVKVEEVK